LELLNPAIRGLNVGELLAPAVLARSLLELASAFLVHANTIEATLGKISFPRNTIVVSAEVEEYVLKMIWGTRLGEPEKTYKQTNALTFIQKLSKNENVKDLLPTYEYLCEIAHPNVIGNVRFWSHVKHIDEHGFRHVEIASTAEGDNVAQIRSNALWGIGWGAGVVRNAYRMTISAIDRIRGVLDQA